MVQILRGGLETHMGLQVIGEVLCPRPSRLDQVFTEASQVGKVEQTSDLIMLAAQALVLQSNLQLMERGENDTTTPRMKDIQVFVGQALGRTS